MHYGHLTGKYLLVQMHYGHLTGKHSLTRMHYGHLTGKHSLMRMHYGHLGFVLILGGGVSASATPYKVDGGLYKILPPLPCG